VLEKLWEEERPGEVRDNDNPEHLEWVYQKSLARAKQFSIEGVTPMLALGVTKNVIPAIASTNALIAAVATNEVFKILSGCNPQLNNYFLYKGATFIGCET
jgi:ubiquitin-activating enzyme E1 C